jgi:hypothetical protein
LSDFFISASSNERRYDAYVGAHILGGGRRVLTLAAFKPVIMKIRFDVTLSGYFILVCSGKCLFFHLKINTTHKCLTFGNIDDPYTAFK